MTTERFNVLLQGTTLRGQDVATVAGELAKLIKRDIDFALRLLCGQPTKLKSGVDKATGARYLEALERIGAAVRLEPETLEVDADLSAPPVPANQGQTSSPAAKPVVDRSAECDKEARVAYLVARNARIASPEGKAAIEKRTAEIIRNDKIKAIAINTLLVPGTYGLHGVQLGIDAVFKLFGRDPITHEKCTAAQRRRWAHNVARHRAERELYGEPFPPK